VGRPRGTKRPTNIVHVLDRGTGQLCCVCFRGGGVDGGTWGVVATRGAAWRVGLIGADFGQAAACGRTHWGLVAHTRHQTARKVEMEEEEEADECTEESESESRSENE